MAILEMYDKISVAIDAKRYALGIFIDLSKAFDTLNHNILLEKLETLWCEGYNIELVSRLLEK